MLVDGLKIYIYTQLYHFVQKCVKFKCTPDCWSMNLTILYGSQTGNAQEVSERIKREARRLGFSINWSAMDHYPKENLIHDDLIIFVCSTTGQGEEPDNMKVS